MNAALGKYEDVSHDLDVAKAMEPSLGGKQQIESEQKLISNEYNSIISPPIQQTVNKSNILGKMVLIVLCESSHFGCSCLFGFSTCILCH